MLTKMLQRRQWDLDQPRRIQGGINEGESWMSEAGVEMGDSYRVFIKGKEHRKRQKSYKDGDWNLK